MSKTILVDALPITESHRAAIVRAAQERGWSVVFREGAETPPQIAEAEILFGADPALVKAAPLLKWLNVPSAGVEQYLPDAAYAAKDVALTNSSGAYGVTIAEHIAMVTLEMMRRQGEYAAITAARRWERGLPIRSIKGSRVTLLGTGDIGREAAKRLRAFEPARVVGVNRSGRHPGGAFDRVAPIALLDGVLPETDLLVMSLPGTPETENLMDGRRLALLPGDAFLVNVGRGSAIDEAALIGLMQSGHLAGAALDVFRTEPLPPKDPIWDCPRLLITPHCAGNMTLGYTVDRIVALFLENLENYCAGRPLLRRVDRARGY